jgi:hypothetical protein
MARTYFVSLVVLDAGITWKPEDVSNAVAKEIEQRYGWNVVGASATELHPDDEKVREQLVRKVG